MHENISIVYNKISNEVRPGAAARYKTLPTMLGEMIII